MNKVEEIKKIEEVNKVEGGKCWRKEDRIEGKDEI